MRRAGARWQEPGLVVLLVLLAAIMAPPGMSAPDRAAARHKALVRRSPALDSLAAAGGIRVIDTYGPHGSALLVEGDSAAIESARDASGGPGFSEVPDRIRLRSRVIDTSGSRLLPPARRRPGGHLELLQFHGPIKPEWLSRMRGAGRSRPIAYVPHNAYIVWTEDPDALGAAGLPLQWRGEYSPSDRLSPELVSSTEPIDVTVQVARAGDHDGVLREIRGRALAILQEPHDIGPLTNIRVTLPPGAAADLAGRDEVVWIEPFAPIVTHDEKSDVIVAGLVNGDSPAGPGYLAWLDAHGLGDLGSILVDVTDTGIGNGATSANHAGLQGRLAYSIDDSGEGLLEDCPGHGTNIAGIIAGGPQPGNLILDADGYLAGLGVAPTVTIGATRIFDCSSQSPSNISYEKIVQDAYARGARISNNSWGGGGSQYNTVAAEYDALVRDANLDPSDGDHSLLPVFSTGNLGPQAYSVGWPATAKNVLSVGGTEGYRPGVSDGCGATSILSDNVNHILSFSSRGPTADGRLKPDIVAPGSHIISLASNAPDYTAAGVCNRYYPPGQQVLNWASGTSQAAAHVSGAAAIALEVYRRSLGADPSPAMLKAMLINHAHDLGSTVAQPSNTSYRPNTAQGWGRVDLSSLVESRARVAFDQSVILEATGESVSYGPFAVDDPSRPVVVTLVWTDAPGTPAGSAWVNDLDLSVQADGQTYLGNVMKDGLSIPGGQADYRNNVENVILSSGRSSFQVEVLAADITGDGVPSHAGETDQDFALYVSNARLAGPTAVITFDPDEAVCGSQLSVTLESLHARGSGRATVVLSTGSDQESVILDESPPGLGVFRGGVDLDGGAPRTGDGILQIVDSQPVTATYLEPDPATGAPVAVTATLPGRCAAPVISDTRVTHSGAFEATVLWKTDRPADSVVHFGAGSNRNLEISDPRLVRDHRVRLTGFPACSLITATVSSTAAGGATSTGPASPLRFASGQSTTSRRIVFYDGMESIGSRWEHHAMQPGAVDDWQLGAPATGTPGPPAGSQVWGTNLDGNYSVGADAVLVSPEIDLTEAVGGELSILHYYSISGGRSPFSENDGAWVEITSDGGVTWTTLEPIGGYPDTVDPDNPYLPSGAPVFAGALSGWSQSRFDVSSFSGSVVKIRFHIWQDPGESVSRSSGWFIDEVEVTAQKTCHIGVLSLDSSEYGCSSSPEIHLADTDLNRSSSVIDTTTVVASSGSDQTTVQLMETGPNTGDFEGTIPLSEVAAPGALAVSEGGDLSVVYDDQDTGDGLPATVSASALIADCTPPPAPTGVVAAEDGAGRLDISWNPIDPAQTPDVQGYRVYYDTDGPGPSYSGTGALQGLSPVRAESFPNSLSLTSLAPCTAHFIAVTAFDQFGNESPYSAETFAYPNGGGPCAVGRMSLAPASPGCSETIDVTVTDSNADLDPGVAGTVTAQAASPSHPAPIPVLLTETASASGVFTGSIPLSATGLPGTLTVSSGDIVSVEYADADDGAGHPGTAHEEVSIGDCSPPAITDVRVVNPGADRATVTWVTDEPSDSTVQYGADPALGSIASASGLSTVHSVPITGLSPCTTTYFTVTSTDPHTNSATATDGGMPFRFGTAREVTIYRDDFESGAPGWTHMSLSNAIDEWELGAPQGDGIKAPASAFSGASVYGTDLDGTYERAADLVLVSPPVPLTLGDAATLEFEHWYDITSVGAPQGFDDGGFLEISDDDGATWTWIQPSPPGYPDIVTTNPYTAFGSGAYAGSTGGWVPAFFILDDWLGRTVRFRFHLFQDVNDHNFVGQGWYIDDVEVRVSLACHEGRIVLDRTEYGCGGSPLTARLVDQDLDLDSQALDTASVMLFSDAEPAGETLLLTEVAPAAGQFEGSLPVSSTDAPGTLAVRSADTIRAIYADADDGSGQPRTTVATAVVSDCSPPVISDLKIEHVSPDAFSVSWTTSEPSTGSVLYGTDASYGGEVTVTSLTTRHDLTVSGLAGCTDYYFTVASTDAGGNTARDDDLSGPGHVATSSATYLLHEDFESGAPGWSHDGQGDTWAFGAPAGFTPPSGTTLAATALATDYTRPSGPDNLDFVLVSPTFSLDGVEAPMLTFAHRYDFAQGFTGRDGGRVEAWTGSRWIPLVPDGGYPGVIDAAAGSSGAPVPGFTGTTQAGFITSTFDLSGVLEPGARVSRIRFRVFVEGGTGSTGRGWLIDDVAVTGSLPCRLGTLAFQKDPITCGDASVGLTLQDRDLDADPFIVEQVGITITSSSDPVPRSVTLTEDGPSSGMFHGTLSLAPSGQSGALAVAAGDTVTAAYQDADDGTGSPRTTLAIVGVAGCAGPTIRGVALTPAGADEVIVRWSTDTPSTSLASLSNGAGPARTAADYRLVTSHTLRMHGLSPCATYIVTLASTDAQGVTTTATGPASGLVVEPPDRTRLFFDDMEGPDPGWVVSGSTSEWQRGTPLHGPAGAFSGTGVYGTDLTGDYNGGTNATLTSPPIDLTQVTSARLTFWHWYDIFASDPPNSTDDSAWVEVAVNGSPAIHYLTPIGGYPDTTDSEDGEPLTEGTPVYAGQTEDWNRAEFDLTPFAGTVIRLRFRLWNDQVELILNGVTGAGWYLDDVEVSSRSYCSPAPSLSGLGTPPLAQGAQAVAVILTGAGFRPGATVISDAGVTVSSVTVVSSSQLSIDLDVDPRAQLGAHAITVVNPDGQTATLAGALQIAFQPARADINGSGRVDGTDLVMFAAAFGSDEGSSNYVAAADLNADGYVDGLDLALLAPLFGSMVP